MSQLIIRQGRMLDPAQQIDRCCDIRLHNGKIAEIGESLRASSAEVIEAKGLLVVPGLVDLHVHLRDPGFEYKEDIVSGTAAAAAGGVTSLACMPNTQPVNDNLAVCRYIISKAQEQGSANVFPVGSISKGMKGEILSEMGELKEGGCVAFSDDGLPVVSSELMRRALEYAATFDSLVISHTEDLDLVAGGVMNEGPVATELGLKGIPWVAEDMMTARDIMLAELTNSRLHLAHISTRGGIELVRQAKKRGVRVSCEVTPHHFTLTDEAVRGYNTNAKMNPPLRSSEDVDAVRQGLADGTVDVIATDHAPHHHDEKNVEFSRALNGIVGLETLLPLTLKLVNEGVIGLMKAIQLLTVAPAQIIGIDRGTLAQGAVADIALIDPERIWTLDSTQLHSRSKNSPFIGWEFQGAVVRTLLGGKTVYQREA